MKNKNESGVTSPESERVVEEMLAFYQEESELKEEFICLKDKIPRDELLIILKRYFEHSIKDGIEVATKLDLSLEEFLSLFEDKVVQLKHSGFIRELIHKLGKLGDTIKKTIEKEEQYDVTNEDIETWMKDVSPEMQVFLRFMLRYPKWKKIFLKLIKSKEIGTRIVEEEIEIKKDKSQVEEFIKKIKDNLYAYTGELNLEKKLVHPQAQAFLQKLDQHYGRYLAARKLKPRKITDRRSEGEKAIDRAVMKALFTDPDERFIPKAAAGQLIDEIKAAYLKEGIKAEVIYDEQEKRHVIKKHYEDPKKEVSDRGEIFAEKIEQTEIPGIAENISILRNEHDEPIVCITEKSSKTLYVKKVNEPGAQFQPIENVRFDAEGRLYIENEKFFDENSIVDLNQDYITRDGVIKKSFFISIKKKSQMKTGMFGNFMK